MNNHKLFVAVVLVVLMLGAIVAACGGSKQDQDAPAQLDGETLVQERCTVCHGLSRVESVQQAEDEWRTTVERMVAKGADLSTEEQEVVIRYLAETYGQ